MTIDPHAFRRVTSGDRGRYSYAFADGSEAELTYHQGAPGVVTIDHTETPMKHRRNGVAAALVERAVADFRAAGQKVIPACPYAHRKFREHADWADIWYRQ